VPRITMTNGEDSATKSNIDRRWLVENRSKIQARMLELDELSPNVREPYVPGIQSLFNMMIGAVFSLWRAVFLVRTDYDFDKEHNHALVLLGTLIDTNAVNFSQDHKSANWMAGYYINNAVFRLHAIATLTQTKKWLGPDTVKWLRSHMDPKVINSPPFVFPEMIWEDTLKGFDLVLNDLTKLLTNPETDPNDREN
jgi:hypothetical protein